MSLAVILAVIDGAPGSESAMKAALELGRRFKARTDLLHVEIDAASAVPVVGEGMSGAAVEQIIESLQAESEMRRKEAERLFKELCVDAKLPVVAPDAAPLAGEFAVSFHKVKGTEPDQVLRRGRLADLIVLARSGWDGDGGLSATFDSALFDSGRPVLLLPQAPVTGFGRSVAVAWDGSREAARAVSTALPFLETAESVAILTARETDNQAEPSQLLGYLAAHGIEGKTWAFTPEGGIGEALLAEMGKAKGDLLVMGAYGHSRLRELVLGGATRSVLANATVPVLMSH